MSARWQKWRRWLRRLALALAVLVAFTLYGWRFGLSQLPEVLPGFARSDELLFVGAVRPESNFWYWAQELARTNALRGDLRPVPSPVPRARQPAPGKGRVPTLPPEARRLTTASPQSDLATWVATRPEIAACLESALAAPDRRPPRPLTRDDVVAFKLLLSSTLWRAAGAEKAGDSAGAVRAYVTAWQLLTAIVPPNEFPELFDERGGEEINVELARPFRRLVLNGPSLARAEAEACLRDLEAIALSATSAEDSYARSVAREEDVLLVARRADWRRATRSFQTAGLLMRQDFFHLIVDVTASLLGRRTVNSPDYHAALYLLRPIQEVCFSAQAAVARRGDFEQIQEASLSQALAALRSGALPPPGSAPWMPDYRRQQRWWRRAFDRPAVWRAASALPPPQFTLESWRWWHVQIESCRLALALRVFKDRQGGWPTRLEQLVPDVLPVLPLDPFSGAPFKYHRLGNGWQFWSVGPRGSAGPGGLDATPQRLFPSTESGRDEEESGGS